MQNLLDLILKPQCIEDDKEDQKLEIDDVVLFTYKESVLRVTKKHMNQINQTNMNTSTTRIKHLHY